ncbi:hypothetical protein HN873_068220, partial [Arachis hypogaea]
RRRIRKLRCHRRSYVAVVGSSVAVLVSCVTVVGSFLAVVWKLYGRRLLCSSTLSFSSPVSLPFFLAAGKHCGFDFDNTVLAGVASSSSSPLFAGFTVTN